MLLSILRADWSEHRLLDALAKSPIFVYLNIPVYIACVSVLFGRFEGEGPRRFLSFLYLPSIQITLGLGLSLTFFVMQEGHSWTEFVVVQKTRRITLAALMLSMLYGFVVVLPLSLSWVFAGQPQLLIDLRALNLAVVLSAPMILLLAFLILILLLWVLFSILGWLSLLCGTALVCLSALCIHAKLREVS
jgi:hypothetical protein